MLELQVLEVDGKLWRLSDELLQRVEALLPHHGDEHVVAQTLVERLALDQYLGGTMNQSGETGDHLKLERETGFLILKYFLALNNSGDDQQIQNEHGQVPEVKTRHFLLDQSAQF